MLEEPEPVPDLVGEARPTVTNLVGLPEDRDLLAELALDVLFLPRRGSGVERREQLGHTQVCEQVRPPRCLGRVRGQDELERNSGHACAKLVRVDVAKALEGIGEGLARRLLILRGVLAAAAQAVMLLGDVDQLEVEAERSENVGLIARRQRPHGVANSVDVAGRARIARAQPDPFLRLEQLIAFLLDEDLAQHRAEQANVAAERGVGLRTCISSHDHHCAVSCRTWSSRSTAAGSSPRAASRT